MKIETIRRTCNSRTDLDEGAIVVVLVVGIVDLKGATYTGQGLAGIDPRLGFLVG